MLIAQGPYLKSSVIVLDSTMKPKPLPVLDSVKISQIAQPAYEGHLFALDEKNNLIAMNLNLISHGDGFSPYQILDFSKYGGGSVISLHQQSLWALHSSGEIQKF